MKALCIVVVLCTACGAESSGPLQPPQPAMPDRIDSWNFGPDVVLLTTNSAHDLVLTVSDRIGQPIAGVPVTWTVTAGGGSVTPALDTTAFDSIYGLPTSRAVHTVGSREGSAIVTASIPTPGVAPLLRNATVVTALVTVFCGGVNTDNVTVPSGRTVGWTFSSRCIQRGRVTKPHNVTFEDDPSVSSADVALGTFTRTFTGPARTIRYRCTLHSTDFDGPAGEVGTVIVQ